MLTAVHPSLRQLLQHRGVRSIHRLHHGSLCNTYRGSRSANHTYEGTIFRIFSGELIAIGALGWAVQKPGLACVPKRAPIFHRFNYEQIDLYILTLVVPIRYCKFGHLQRYMVFSSLETSQRCKILDGTSTGF